MKTVSVGDIADRIDYGVTASAVSEPVGPKMLRITDIQHGAVDWETVPHCPSDTKGIDTRQLATGDIVFARTGSVGKSFLIQECPEDAVFASYLIRLRISPERADSRYIGHFFKSASYWNQVIKVSEGVVQPGVNATKLKELLVPLLPIEEQRRIVEVLNAVEALITKRHQSLIKLEHLSQAIFDATFGDSTKWPTGKLGVHVPTTSGGTPTRSRPDYFEGPIPWVKSGELSSGVVASCEESITEEALADSSAKLMPVGTVLVAMYGATVGEVAVLRIEAATNQAICCISPNESVTGPFLVGLLRSRKEDLIRQAAGGAQPNISQSIIRGLEIPLPPIEVQMEYSQLVMATQELREKALRSAVQLDELLASVQQRAFRGEL